MERDFHTKKPGPKRTRLFNVLLSFLIIRHEQQQHQEAFFLQGIPKVRHLQ